MNTPIQTELEAAAFRRLLKHLQDHIEVQNIDLMILADFCRNCLAKWYSAAAQERGLDIDYPAAQEIVYGMPYREWKDKYQTPATPEQIVKMEERQRLREASGH
ncbi:MAG: deoxycytidine triphosphate deaminase [Proteobacteria bacterium]|nr:deoxycytidine triphosphate deaminase [Pseudomonadota bacterium]